MRKKQMQSTKSGKKITKTTAKKQLKKPAKKMVNAKILAKPARKEVLKSKSKEKTYQNALTGHQKIQTAEGWRRTQALKGQGKAKPKGKK